MKKNSSFANFLKYHGICFIVAIGLIIGIFEIISSFKEFDERKNQIENLILQQKKEIIYQEVNHIVDFIDYERKNFSTDKGLSETERERDIKYMVKNYINNYRFGKDRKGYIFVAKLEKHKGKIKTIGVVNPNNPLKYIGKVIPANLKDIKGKLFHKEMVDKALKRGEGFITYHFKKFKSNKISKKITYIKYYKDWQWMIGAGLYLDDIEKEVALMKKSLHNELKKKMIISIFVICVIVIIFIFLVNIFSIKLKNDFLMFFEFFKHITKEEKPIELEKIKFSEFSEMAESANIMLENKKKADSKLIKEKEKLFVTLNSIGDAVIVTDTSRKIELMNPIAEYLTGWQLNEAVGKPLEQVFKIINETTRKTISNPVDKVLKYGKIIGLANHTVLISKNKMEYNISDSAAPIRDENSKILGVILVFRDITEKLKMEKEFLKVEKLKSLGVLAGGLAHDFNNILTGVFGNLELAKKEMSPDHLSYSFLEKSFKSLERARHITQQLLLFSRGNEPTLGVVDLKTLIEDTVKFNLSGTGVKHAINIESNLWPVKADKGQISHLISNLVINGAQAMKNEGTLYISCENINCNNVLLKGKYVKLQIKDEGAGIPENFLDKIFEPYFTTKENGSGLGLSIVYNIVKNHNGHIEVESSEGIGTTFTIYLPAGNIETIIHKKEVLEDSVKKDLSGKVLVMDDEDIVRETIKDMLSSIGFTVKTVSDGKEAVEIYRECFEKGEKFDFVVMDLTIRGGIGGKEAIKEVLKIDSSAKVIVASGYSEGDVISNYFKYGFKGVVIKPFTIEQLKKEIIKILKED